MFSVTGTAGVINQNDLLQQNLKMLWIEAQFFDVIILIMDAFLEVEEEAPK